MSKLLMRLMDEIGVSGDEERVRNIIIKEIKPYVDSIKVDKLGNLIAIKKGKRPTIMLAAHMDEIGLMVKNIHSNGTLSISVIGGLEPLVLLGQSVKLMTRKGKSIKGIITTRELSTDHEVIKLPATYEMFIDTGLTKSEIKKLGIDIGTYVGFDQKSDFLGGKENMIVGKAADDRTGCYILVELIKRLRKTKHEINYTFTVQEEMGLYGSKTSSYSLNPDWAIAVDTTNSNEHDLEEEATREIGGGPVLTYKDAELLSNQVLDDWIMALAKKHKINIQPQVSDFGTTDAMSMTVSKGGIPSTVISIPIKNIHSVVSICDMKDINDAIDLLELLIKNPPHFVK